MKTAEEIREAWLAEHAEAKALPHHKPVDWNVLDKLASGDAYEGALYAPCPTHGKDLIGRFHNSAEYVELLNQAKEGGCPGVGVVGVVAGKEYHTVMNLQQAFVLAV